MGAEIYVPKIASALEKMFAGRLAGTNTFCAFQWQGGYVQCLSNPGSNEMLCEAQSAISYPALARILTDEKVALLQRFGFSLPEPATGRPNYFRFIKIDNVDTGEVFYQTAQWLMQVATEVYGYVAATPLAFKCTMPLLGS